MSTHGFNVLARFAVLVGAFVASAVDASTTHFFLLSIVTVVVLGSFSIEDYLQTILEELQRKNDQANSSGL